VVALENLRARFNIALAVSAAGFSDTCPTPGRGDDS
jgi:hypothetical protein